MLAVFAAGNLAFAMVRNEPGNDHKERLAGVTKLLRNWIED